MIRAHAEVAQSTNRTADDRAYTAWAMGNAVEAGMSPEAARNYVAGNVAAANANPGRVASRGRVMGQIGRRRR